MSSGSEPLRLVLMGVAGCGKSSVGAALAPVLNAVYLDGDDLHPPENIAKMAAGIPLDDTDRAPWLRRCGQRFATAPRLILGCSALKRAYRDIIRDAAGGPVRFVHLAGSRELIAARMTSRPGHFMPPALLDSQFAALEAPGADEGAVTVDIALPLPALVAAIAAALSASA